MEKSRVVVVLFHSARFVLLLSSLFIYVCCFYFYMRVSFHINVPFGVGPPSIFLSVRLKRLSTSSLMCKVCSENSLGAFLHLSTFPSFCFLHFYQNLGPGKLKHVSIKRTNDASRRRRRDRNNSIRERKRIGTRIREQKNDKRRRRQCLAKRVPRNIGK